MTEWALFGMIGQNMVTYLTGSYAILGIIAMIFFLVALLVVGLEFKYAAPLSLPIFAAFVAAGWFGELSWVLNIGLIVVAIIYGVAMVKLAA